MVLRTLILGFVSYRSAGKSTFARGCLLFVCSNQDVYDMNVGFREMDVKF